MTETPDQFSVEWQDSGREPQCAPNPAYPTGKAIRLTGSAKERAKHCTATVPYPAKRCGLYVVECTRCGLRIGMTTAGRPDDPTSIELLCGPDTALQMTALYGEPYEQ